jgi:branched-chain amino acid transport system ATP-binding protein
LGPSDSPVAVDQRNHSAHPAPLLEVRGLSTGYGKKQVLDEVTMTVRAGEAVAVIGHNGAGKTTLLRSVFGLQRPWAGSVSIAGNALGTGHDAARAVDLGLAMIPAERFVFPDLSVLDNLRLSARGLAAGERNRRIEAAYTAYPVLRERARQPAGTMSGGEQRMVSLSMALMPQPRLLLLDEPSLGLSPVIVQQLMDRVRLLVREGMAVILVEQNIPAALSVASRVYVVRSGRIIQELSAEELRAMGREKWWQLF